MIEIFQIICRKCGATAKEGKTMADAEGSAESEGFIRRPDHWLCGDCGGVKKMVTSDIKHYERKGVKKI